MITSWAQTQTDQLIVTGIAEVSGNDSDYWAFRKDARRDGVHGLIRYPAMMIPTMQSRLLEIFKEAHGNAQKVLDPFVGGGTMLTEAMEQGLDFVGYDINPLAILACKVKSGPFSVNLLEERISSLLAAITSDSKRTYEVSFPGQAKWFTKGASIGLSRIHRAVSQESDLWTRRFLWLSMAETIRRISNSRTSTYKLHIRPENEIDATAHGVVKTFGEVVLANTKRVLDQQEVFLESGVLQDGRYRGDVGITYQDVAKLNPTETADQCDLLFTSPPYGDNATTIPYGQFSYLSLNWIPLGDIDKAIPANVNANTHSIDSASMGGSLRKTEDKAEALAARSDAFKDFYFRIGNEKSTYAKRLSSFCFDLHQSIQSLAHLVAPNGYMVWTLGNRSLDGNRVPLDQIVLEFFESHDMRRVAQFLRPIPCKRMPSRNSCSDTMQDEMVIVVGA